MEEMMKNGIRIIEHGIAVACYGRVDDFNAVKMNPFSTVNCYKNSN